MTRPVQPIAMLALGTSLLIAATALPGSAAGKANPEEALPALKRLELDKLATLQRLSRTTETCIRQANSLDALHQCRIQEHLAHRELRRSVRQQQQALSQRYGLPMPKPRTQDEAPKGAPEER